MQRVTKMRASGLAKRVRLLELQITRFCKFLTCMLCSSSFIGTFSAKFPVRVLRVLTHLDLSFYSLINISFYHQVIACLDVRANDKGDLVVTKGDQYDVREHTKENEVDKEY